MTEKPCSTCTKNRDGQLSRPPTEGVHEPIRVRKANGKMEAGVLELSVSVGMFESRALVLLPFEGIVDTANHVLALNDGHKPGGDGSPDSERDSLQARKRGGSDATSQQYKTGSASQKDPFFATHENEVVLRNDFGLTMSLKYGGVHPTLGGTTYPWPSEDQDLFQLATSINCRGQSWSIYYCPRMAECFQCLQLTGVLSIAESSPRGRARGSPRGSVDRVGCGVADCLRGVGEVVSSFCPPHPVRSRSFPLSSLGFWKSSVSSSTIPPRQQNHPQLPSLCLLNQNPLIPPIPSKWSRLVSAYPSSLPRILDWDNRRTG